MVRNYNSLVLSNDEITVYLRYKHNSWSRFVVDTCPKAKISGTRRYPRGIQILVSAYLLGAEFAGGGGILGKLKLKSLKVARSA